MFSKKNAKKYCIAFGCLNTDRDPTLSFFTLPTDIKRCQKWLTLIGREDLLQREDLKKNMLICSAHFKESSFKIFKRLKENALPSMLLHNQPREGSSCSEAQSSSAQVKANMIILSNNEENVTVGTQTESSRSLEEQTQTLKSLTKETPRKRKLVNKILECKLKRRKLDQELTKIKNELEAEYQPITCNDLDEKIKKELEAEHQPLTCNAPDEKIKKELEAEYQPITCNDPDEKNKKELEAEYQPITCNDPDEKIKKELEAEYQPITCNDPVEKIKKELEAEYQPIICNDPDEKIKKELEAEYQPITCNDPDDEVGRRFKILIDWQNKIKNKYKGNRYDAEYKVFSLNLYYSSPHAYRCLQTVLNLPSKSTLNRLKMNIPPKFDNRLLDSLALKINSLPDTAKYCTICVEEITLKRNLYYNIKTDEVIGFHNVNGKMSPEIASNAFVIMLQGIYFIWKQPLTYALLATAKHYEEIDLWMNEVITKLSTIGIKVKAIVSDQGSNFDKFAKEVKKVTIEKPYFKYDDTKIFYIFDVPHLIKCIRNNLLTSDFLYNGNKISWAYIEQLYKDQKEKNLRLIPKITDAHIQPNNFQRMKVKLAVQTLSRTVSAALHTYIDLGKISDDARPTADFLELMNNLFDILNSSKIKCCNKFQAAFKLSKEQENVFNNAMNFFAATKAINRKSGKDNTSHIKSFVNFQISIMAIKLLYENLKKDGFEYLLTRRLNQDNLEKKIGSIRQQGGSCSEPTPIQFRRAFSKLFLRNMLKSSPSANCEMDICEILLKAEDIMKAQILGIHSSPQTCTICLGGETDYRIDLPDENALTYVSGFLFFKCVNKHKCPDLNKVLETVPELGETNLFTRYEAFNKKSGFYGSLKMPPKEFIKYIQNLEKAFVQHFEHIIQNNPVAELLKLFKSVPQQIPCTCFPVNYLLKLFARFRIFSTIKFNNRQFKDGKNGIEKYIKVSHL